MKVLLTSEANQFANVNLVKVPPGGVVSRHQHPEEIETVYVLSGQSVLTLDDTDVPFKPGQIVAIPMGLEHELHDGRILQGRVNTTKGEPQNPLTPEEVRAKFEALATMYWPDQHVQSVAKAVEDIEHLEVRRLMDRARLAGSSQR